MRENNEYYDINYAHMPVTISIILTDNTQFHMPACQSNAIFYCDKAHGEVNVANTIAKIKIQKRHAISIVRSQFVI